MRDKSSDTRIEIFLLLAILLFIHLKKEDDLVRPRTVARRRYVVSFANGPADRVARMRRELRELLPEFEHVEVERMVGESGGELWLRLMRRFAPFSIAHTAALLGAPNSSSNYFTVLNFF